MPAAGFEAEQICNRGRAFGNGTLASIFRIAAESAADASQIGELKAKIQADKTWEVAQQKLIYSGMHATADPAVHRNRD
jgi:hypothetical protein